LLKKNFILSKIKFTIIHPNLRRNQMKQTFNRILWLAAISPVALSAKPASNTPMAERSSLAYPTPHQWHFTFGADTGIENFDITGFNGTYILQDKGSNYVLGFNQSVGYGRWFYLQAKESASIGVTSLGAVPSPLRAFPRFLDLDLRAYFPLSLSKTYRVSLQPQIGFASHWANIRSRGNTDATIEDHFTLYRTRSFAPLFGLALGCDVSDSFNFRFGIAIEVHNLRSKGQQTATSEATEWARHKIRRGGVNSSLDLNYRVGSNTDLTGSLNHINYCPLGYEGIATNNPYTSYLNRFSYKAGVRWTF